MVATLEDVHSLRYLRLLIQIFPSAGAVRLPDDLQKGTNQTILSIRPSARDRLVTDVSSSRQDCLPEGEFLVLIFADLGVLR